MYCTYCGVQNGVDANFCFNCGKELSRRPTEEVVESVTDEPQSKVQAHHPWMSEQSQTREESSEQVQDRGEVPNARQSVWSQIKGWSKTKKILVGITALLLSFVCAVAITPTEDGSSGEVATTKESKLSDESQTCESEEFQKYGASVSRSIFVITEGLEKNNNLFKEAAQSPTLIVDKNWLNKVDRNNTALEGGIFDIRDASLPDELKDIHKILLEATDELYQGVIKIRKGVKEVDVDSLESSAKHIERYIEGFSKYTSEMEDYCNG